MIVEIDSLQPMEIFLRRPRVEEHTKNKLEGRQIDPIVIIPLQGRCGILDGNTRTYVAHKFGETYIEAVLITNIASRTHKILFQDAYNSGVRHVKDLHGRVYSNEEVDRLYERDLDRLFPINKNL